MQVNKFNFKVVKKDEQYGKFELSPIYGGFGHTLGNSLRRILFISIPGSAITKIKIDGTNHLFTGLDGVKEDMIEVSLNLKQIKFAYDKDEPVVLKLSKKGKGVVTAADIADTDTCKVSNPDQFIATLTEDKAHLDIEMTVEKGYGYTLASETKTDIIGEIILDATFTPIKKVNYEVVPTRKGKKTNFDTLTFEIWTDGSIDPEKALKDAASDLVSSLSQIATPKVYEEEVVTVESGPINKAADISVEEIELPLRVTNALKKAGFNTIDDLQKAGRLEVRKAKNVGEKSIKTIEKWLKDSGYTWK